MTVVTLDKIRPIPRADQPWTSVRWEEAGVADGPRVVLETQPLDPIDADPTSPIERMLTTTAATLEHGWYVLTFIDADGNESELDAVPGDDVAAGLLASIDDVDRYLTTQPRVASRSADIDRELLWQMLEAASDRMRRARPDRTLIPTPASPSAPPLERTFPIGWSTGRVAVPDLRTVSSIRLDDDRELVGADYELVRRFPDDPALWVRVLFPALTVGSRSLTIAGHWGPSRVFPSVREACIAWVGRVFHQRTARFADNAPAGPDGGVLGYFRNLPPDVKVVLDDLWIPGV